MKNARLNEVKEYQARSLPRSLTTNLNSCIADMLRAIRRNEPSSAHYWTMRTMARLRNHSVRQS